MSEVYYCKNCGGVMEFDVKTQSLKCSNCETLQEIEKNTEGVQEHTLNHYHKKVVRAEEKKSSTMQCPGCGALVEVEATSTAKDCPYCGIPFVLAKKQESSIIPDGVVPFTIDKNAVGDIFRRWMKGRWLAPGELKHLYQQDKLQGIYIPYWTFDAKADAEYTAEGGRDHVVHYKDKDGHDQTRVETHWSFTRGRMNHFFDDILVHASKRLDEGLIQRIEPFNTQNIPAYTPDYLSGYNSEVYTVELEEAHVTAKRLMEDQLRRLAEQDVLRRYDHVRGVRISARYSGETYKHVLLPVYATAYQYKGKQYTVLVNGQTGEIKGEYPKSPFKIALLALAAAVVVGLIAWYSYSDSEDYGMQPKAETTYVCENKEDEKEGYGREEIWDYLEISSLT